MRRSSRWDGSRGNRWLTGPGFTNVQGSKRQRSMMRTKSAMEGIGWPVWTAGRKTPDSSRLDSDTPRKWSIGIGWERS